VSQPFAAPRARGLFRSLAARVSFFVFAAALTSALAVAANSAWALRAFLRGKIEQKIPSALLQVRDRLDLWYAQRLLDVQIISRSALVVDRLARAPRSAPARLDPRDRAEIEQYLRYVLENLSPYASIFILDAGGRPVLGVGNPPTLAPAVREKLAGVEKAAVSDALSAGGSAPIQVVSSVIRSPDEHRLGTLHVVLPLSALEQELRGEAAAGFGRTLVFDADGRFLAASSPLERAPSAPDLLARRAGPGQVRDYVAEDGLRVVGSALAFPRLRWTLVLEEDYQAAFAPIFSMFGRTVALDLAIVLVLSALAFAVVASLVRPLHALSDCARRLRDGEEQVELPVVTSSDEIGILARSFAEMVHSLKRSNEVLEQLAITDGLTKIHNHRFFQDQLGKEISRAERTRAPLALVLVDLDDFKALNDRFGHAVGDGVLEQIAALLVSETRDNDLVARYGGEEFAVLAPDTDRAGALALAEKLRLAISGTRFLAPPASEAVGLTVSVGVAAYHGDREAFFHEADRALYAAKGSGKDCVVVAGAEDEA
jgi:diguanylate cyclase (GGDEF)-like protein